MQKLKSRQKQVPNGFRFRQSEISWDSTKVLGLHPSFDTLVRAVQSARKANPAHAAKHKWARDTAGVANDVENYQVRIWQTMGYTSYLTDAGGGAPPPLAQHRNPDEQKLLDVAAKRARNVFGGVSAITEWQKDGAKAVPQQQAESRAAVCIECPLNGQGDFGKWFIAPAAAAIKRQIEWLTSQKLSTSHDAKLNICEGCLCAMKLKVWMPIEYIKKGLTGETISELRKGKDCWQLKDLLLLQVNLEKQSQVV